MPPGTTATADPRRACPWHAARCRSREARPRSFAATSRRFACPSNAPRAVDFEQHVAGTIGYTDVATTVTAADGAYSLSVKPAATTTYRAVWAGGTIATIVYPAASATTTVQVKPK